MQKYFNNSIMSKFIKNLIHNVYIPICDTVNIGDFLIAGQDYVYETDFIRCTKTGYLGGKYKQDVSYNVVWGKNRLYNQYLALTKQNIFANIHEEPEGLSSVTPFAVLNLNTKKLTYYYGVYKFTGNETYTQSLSEDDLSFTIADADSTYIGLEDSKTLSNRFPKSASNNKKEYTTITLFENNTTVTINNFRESTNTSTINQFKQWTVRNELFISYKLATPIESGVLTDDEVNYLMGITDVETSEISSLGLPNGEVVFNYPAYKVSYIYNEQEIDLSTSSFKDQYLPFSTKSNGITYSINSNGTVQISGTAEADSYLVLNANFNTNEYKGFLVSGLPDNAIDLGLSYRITNINLTTTLQEITENNVAIEGSGSITSFSIFVPQGRVIENVMVYPMIRSKEYISDEYVEYKEPEYRINNILETTVNKAEYLSLFPYEYGKVYNKLTQNYTSNSAYYDYNTHQYFGKFLRCLRDVKGIDLMPYYNLYSDNYLSNYRITLKGFEEYYNNTFKILKVPIKFNKTYTICIDCSSSVFICPALFTHNMPLVIRQDSGREINMTERLNSYNDYIKEYSSLGFKSPITYRVDNTALTSRFGEVDCAYFHQYERNLYLLIQLPIYNKSTVCILEGDFTETQGNQIINPSESYKLHDYELNKVFCSNLSLMQFSTKDNYVYSDRIVEYMLWNVITSHESIVGNVEYTQDLIPNIYSTKNKYGIWNNQLRSRIFDFSINNKKTKRLDLNGFVDKDTEQLLLNQYFS